MTTCKAVTKEVLNNPVEIRIDDESLNFETARLIADQKAMELAAQPMLMGWYDATSGRFSPNVTCCSEHKPGWIVYAEARGGDLTIDVNDEKYVFIYCDLQTL
jgi:hypothetical protein